MLNSGRDTLTKHVASDVSRYKGALTQQIK